VRIVACISPQLFRLQDAAYRDRICSEADRLDGMAITNRAYRLMLDWVTGPIGETYSLSSDWDNRWRTGGTVEEVIDEAHLGPQHIIDAITRYAHERAQRHARLRKLAAGLDADA
jgi:transketolase